MFTTGATGLLLNELGRFDWDVIGLAETHWIGVQENTLRGVRIISSGREAGHSSGVGLLLSPRAQKSFLKYEPICDRILSARFRTAVGYTTICQIYAPTTEASEATMEGFYNDLQQFINKTPKKDCIVLMGDFNAKVGTRNSHDAGVIGKFGMGERNERGERLVDFCSLNNLYITNTRFKQSKQNRIWTWESPGGTYHNQIDYILVSKNMIGSVQNSRSFPSADFGSDHQLVMANVKLKLKTNRQQQGTRKMDIGKLSDPVIKRRYQDAFDKKLHQHLTGLSR